MKYGSLILEKKEYVFLKRILNISGYVEDFEVQNSFQQLNNDLKNAHILDEEEMPTDVIRFNSSVLVSSDKGWKKTLQIVIPAEKDVENSKISILTPIGAALFGHAEEDVIQCNFSGGEQKLTVEVVTLEDNYKKIEVPI
ncbi:Regulator of nucleoside diphosphate kinase [Kordia antarctica]|uniref:Regulator of nucleoside diphosphate kinase n=1 Tax=Kordia antarctica TaxID=1218801 RepID=A0A7L4ZS29_9FLAO|nr:GreA/GreB family elongation factor [Kordia antarctica]QHI39301.1 Regulator of nucleoside diphosphate kinase [Kordia antarctica]